MNEVQQAYIGNFTSKTTLQEKSQLIFENLDISESSRKDYKSRIWLYLDYLQEHPFSRNTFLDFKRYLAKRNDLAIASKSKYLTVARVFLKELNKQGIIPADVTQNVKSFQQSKKHKRFGLNQDEVNILLDKLEELPNTKSNLRLKTVCSLLIFQGLRQCEVVRLDAEDISLSHKTAMIHGKGRDDKEAIDLHPRTVEALCLYIDLWQIKSGALFVSCSNNNRNGRITTRTIRNLVKSFLTNLEIDNTTHGFRHFFTTRLIEMFSNDLLTVAKFSRHKSVETLQVYNDNISHKNNLPKYYQAFN